jgi:hypothetical protein
VFPTVCCPRRRSTKTGSRDLYRCFQNTPEQMHTLQFKAKLTQPKFASFTLPSSTFHHLFFMKVTTHLFTPEVKNAWAFIAALPTRLHEVQIQYRSSFMNNWYPFWSVVEYCWSNMLFKVLIVESFCSLLSRYQLSRYKGVTIDGVWIGECLLTTYTHHSELQAITVPLLIFTIHKSPQHSLRLLPTCCVFTSRSLATASNSGDSSAPPLRFYLVTAGRANLTSQLAPRLAAVSHQPSSLSQADYQLSTNLLAPFFYYQFARTEHKTSLLVYPLPRKLVYRVVA